MVDVINIENLGFDESIKNMISLSLALASGSMEQIKNWSSFSLLFAVSDMHYDGDRRNENKLGYLSQDYLSYVNIFLL